MFLTQKKSNGVDTDKNFQETVSEDGIADTSMLARIEIVNRFTTSLCSREASIRATALEVMEKSIFQWMEGSEDMDDSKISNGNVTNGNNAHVDYRSLIIMHIPALLRLSVSCPFRDVRDKCQQVIDYIREKAGIPIPFHQSSVGPSFFIPPEDLPDVGSTEEKPHSLFIDAFLQNSRLDHVTQVMGHHITYLDIFLRTQNFILRGDGPLPYDYRHFIAIMAAGRHQCSYLINLQRQEFILQGGDQAWLKGLAKIPKKLRDLYEINKILAHRPWLLNEKHIEKLTKGTDSWSLAEVVHAIVLLTHFHSLSSFVFGCGVNDELDQHNDHHTTTTNNTSTAAAKQPTPTLPIPASKTAITEKSGSGRPETGTIWLNEADSNVGVDTLMQRMKSLSERSEQFSAEERAKRFQHVESQSVELLTRSSVRLKPSIGHFIDDPDFVYEDFARRGESSDIPTFRVHDYSWDDHGYSLVNRLYNDVGNLLDEKFKTAYNLTYYTMGGRMGVDTSRFRRAIWNYIQCMFGIRHDDYDYGEVNQLLERSLKAFIKSACCFPERVAKSDYDRVLREFKHSEKVHVNLMILEARMQAELLYALRAVMRYMT